MNMNQQGLIYLLSVAIHGEKIQKHKISGFNWKEIFKLAKEQQICQVLYPVIKELEFESKDDNDVISEWKKLTILSSIVQKENINRITFVLSELRNAGKEAIALKGLIMRNYYPLQELRTMSDYDILMHTEDLEETEKILLSLGYLEDHRDSKHIVFIHSHYMPIEIHWLLTDPSHFKYGQYLERNIWKNAESIDTYGTNVLAPSLENQMLHLFLHLVVHFIYSGFGLKQLIDIFVLVDKEGNNIDWNKVYKNVKECKLENFVIIIFEICRRLLDMKVPDIFYSKSLDKNLNIDLLIYNIFYGGTFGGAFGKIFDFMPLDENIIMQHKDIPKSSHIWNNGKYIMRMIFPETQSLKDKYYYAKKNSILVPIAWMQRIIDVMLRKDYNFREKKLFMSSKSQLLRSRSEVLKWLELDSND